MTRNALSDHFREQIGYCEEYGSPFTARLLECMVADLEAGGPTADLVGDWSGPPRADVVSLRLAGALHHAALTARDEALAAEYPAQRVDWIIERVWPIAREFLARERAWVASFIRSPPQTNEVRRSIALLCGFLAFARDYGPELDTLEIGASAGLNLHWDAFRYVTPSWSWGAGTGAEIGTIWKGPPPALEVRPHVASRAGCDLNPLDIRDPVQRMQLRSYIWADQPERLQRFDSAAALAINRGVHIERADAASWLGERLAQRSPQRATLVYHSVFLQYPSQESRSALIAAIRAAGERAGAEAPLGWLRLEPEALLGGPRESTRFLVDLVTWPGATRQVLAITDGHVRGVCTEESQLQAAQNSAR